MYDEPSEQLVKHSQEYTLGCGVVGNPEKAARWLEWIDESFRHVFKMANARGRVSTRDDRSVSTIRKTPEVPGLGEEDGFPQEEGQDLVRTRARACQDFHGAV